MERVEAYGRPELAADVFTESDALLDALTDLEDAHRAGKLSDADYAAQRERLEVQYIAAVEGRDATP